MIQGGPLVTVSGELAGVLCALISAGVSLWTRAAVAELKSDFLLLQQGREDRMKTEYASSREFAQLDHRVSNLEEGKLSCLNSATR